MTDTLYRIYRKQLDGTLVPTGDSLGVGSRAALVKWFTSQNGRSDATPGVTYVLIPASNHHEYTPQVTTTVAFK